MLDKRQMQFNLSNLIILRHLWGKGNFCQYVTGYQQLLQSNKGTCWTWGKKPQTNISNFKFSYQASRTQVQEVGAKTPVQKQSPPQKDTERLERKFCLDSSCQNENLLKVFLMYITGSVTTGICIQTRTLQIFEILVTKV